MSLGKISYQLIRFQYIKKMKQLFFLLIIFLSKHCLCAPLPSISWHEDLNPIDSEHWSYHTARHLAERAGFGADPETIAKLRSLTPEEAVSSFVDTQDYQNLNMDFDHSGIHDPSLEPFPPSRPAATEMAKETGQAMGIKVKPKGNRRLQPVVDRFFYWLRASRLETHRLGYWWANRMLNSQTPLQEKISLFWHGHFATSENKVRDYRKMHLQNILFREKGLGNFRDLTIAVAKDPAMLSFLDAGRNIKGSPNENFAREVMELFTMGVGNYTEHDIREAARAFTGWNFSDLDFVVNKNQHDEGTKNIFGTQKNYNGVEVIDLILEQKITAQYIAEKLYKYFVNQKVSAEMKIKLGNLLYRNKYEIRPFLRTIFLSKDFYSAGNRGNRIKPPVELVISTYKKLGLVNIPGVPDFNTVTRELGQQLFYPPTVAGWKHGNSWMTPALLLSRGNFFYDVAFPDINFIAPDRYPMGGYKTIRDVNDKLATGMDIANATSPSGVDVSSMSMMMVDRDEDFNTRLGTFRGWQQAIQRVKPILRDTATFNLSQLVLAADCSTAKQAVEYLVNRFLSVPIDTGIKDEISNFLTSELGTSQLSEASSYMEEGLRLALHIILSLPEYQLG